MINEQGARSYIHWSYAAQEVLGGQHGFKMLTLCRRRIANFQ
ncbi:hypothetical protein OTK50_03180 [Bacillus sp. NEAU-CP5]|nr:MULTISPECIES: hypothetical protein [Bacillus]MCX3304234.1 hypothetical protein [Bacillus velezensis]MCX8438834.1 hypothetical protein [Bacillus sp. NEAU-CP5]MEC1336842.1 hypothetical protein [Bacillus velezensis]WJF84012.1 hypothetical protein QRA13_05540 [Bacillus velezensis]